MSQEPTLCYYCQKLPAKYFFANGRGCCEPNYRRCPAMKEKVGASVRKNLVPAEKVETTELCAYGCGKVAKYRVDGPNGKLCCSESRQACSSLREKQAKTLLTYKKVETDEKCYYCGNKADYLLSGGKFCCSTSPNSCPSVQKKNQESQHYETSKQPIEIETTELCDWNCGNQAKWKFPNGKLCCHRWMSQCPGFQKKRHETVGPSSERWKKTHIILKCDFCGKEFEKPAKGEKEKKRHFCSHNCLYKSLLENNPARTVPKIRLTCEICGAEYERLACEIKNKKSRTCSSKCSRIWMGQYNSKVQSRKVEWKCLNCEKIFLVSPSKTDSKYCSEKCRYEYVRSHPTREYITVKCPQCDQDFQTPKLAPAKFCNMEHYIRYRSEHGDYFSAVSQELFWILSFELGEDVKVYFGEHGGEFSIGIKFFDFAVPDRKKIIDFHGDFWHCNPVRYDDSDRVDFGGRTREEIRKCDEMKRKLAEENGFSYLVVWQKDFTDDPERVVETCLEFLNS